MCLDALQARMLQQVVFPVQGVHTTRVVRIAWLVNCFRGERTHIRCFLAASMVNSETGVQLGWRNDMTILNLLSSTRVIVVY